MLTDKARRQKHRVQIGVFLWALRHDPLNALRIACETGEAYEQAYRKFNWHRRKQGNPEEWL